MAMLLAGSAQAASKGGVGVYDIRDFGAVGDAKTDNTKAVQAAIDAATADRGGTVLVPAGVFTIGTIEMKSSVTLHLSTSGRLLGSQDASKYREAVGIPLGRELDVTLEDGNWSLIYAINATNFAIEGPGTIDGGGPPPRGLTGRRRPYALLFYHCKNLAVRNIDLVNCPYHMIRPIQSAYIKMEGIRIHSRNASNNDGFHFISCEYVHVNNCDVQCCDDACALFGSCKFVTVSNSTFSTRWSIFRFGGGVTEDVTVSNCVIAHTYGCPIKFQGGQGDSYSHFKNITFTNLTLDDVTGPISISISGAPDAGTMIEPPPFSEPVMPAQPARREGAVTVKNISFNNIHGTVCTAVTQYPDFQKRMGLNPGERMSAIVLNCVGTATMENVSFNDINLVFGGGGTAEAGANRNVRQTAGEYFSLGPIPAYGMFARNVKGLRLNNVNFQVATPELRPAIVFDGVKDAALTGVSMQGNEKAESAMRFVNAQDVLVTSPRLTEAAPVFLSVEGKDNKNIKIEGGDYSKAPKAVTFATGASESAVKTRE